MIKSISISNYKFIKEVIKLDFSEEIDFSVLFGKNNVGKSVIFDAVKKFREVFLYGMRSVERMAEQIDTTYIIEFVVDNQTFLFKTILNYEKSDIIYESLTLQHKTTSYNYYIRDLYDLTIGDRLKRLFTPFDFERFNTYLYDLKFDRREFMLSHLSIKNFTDSQHASILNKLTNLIKNIRFLNPNEDINFYTDMTDSHYVSVLRLIQQVMPDVSSLQYKSKSLDDLRYSLNRHRYDHLLDAFRNHVITSHASSYFVEVYGQFYKLKGRTLDALTVQSIDVHFFDGTVSSFNEVSSGTRSLILLSMMISNSSPYELLFVDELTNSIDHLSMLTWLSHTKPLLQQKHMKLIFTSHDMLLLDSTHFNLKEIIYVIKHPNIKLKYLHTLGIRSDKKLLNLYLEGFFNTLS